MRVAASLLSLALLVAAVSPASRAEPPPPPPQAAVQSQLELPAPPAPQLGVQSIVNKDQILLVYAASDSLAIAVRQDPVSFGRLATAVVRSAIGELEQPTTGARQTEARDVGRWDPSTHEPLRHRLS